MKLRIFACLALIAVAIAIATFTRDWINPFALIAWTIYLMGVRSNVTGPKADILDAVDGHAFYHAIQLLAVDVTTIAAFAIIIYWTNRNDRWKLSTEKGSADWIMPEDLASSGLLPHNSNPTLMPTLPK
jgi:hypothetical protein